MISKPRVVAVGGGSGLSVLLRTLKPTLGRQLGGLTAIVTVSDDGGSSGRLRRDFGVLPPGDIRNCLVALARDEDLVAKLFQYRFADGEGLAGHSFGNLFLTALTGITGDFYQAILTAEELLSVRGRILPATLSDVRLKAWGRSGRFYDGESEVGGSGEPIERLELEPARVAAFPRAASAVRDADLVILGPGSLYTSILPNLLIPGILEAIRSSKARVLLPLNLMTQPGETEDMTAVDHLEALSRHTGDDLVDTVLVHHGAYPDRLLAHYADVGSVPVHVDPEALGRLGVEVTSADLLASGELIRHDPAKLRRAVLAMATATLRTGAQTDGRAEAQKEDDDDEDDHGGGDP